MFLHPCKIPIKPTAMSPRSKWKGQFTILPDLIVRPGQKQLSTPGALSSPEKDSSGKFGQQISTRTPLCRELNMMRLVVMEQEFGN